VDIASEQVDRVFTYRVPEAFSRMLFQGSRVRVPFGFREKEGFVVRLKETADYDEIDQLGQAIENTFVSETSHQIYIGIGEPKSNLAQLSESMREARRAIDVGRMYCKDEFVFVYRKLLIERFLADVPREMGLRDNAMLFNRKTARLFNDEMVHTIEKFFENSLNLSETARQLYIHRNTLVYRLDKLQKTTGLDLRVFEDAITFKIALMVVKYMKYMESFEY
jgi:carbohydrate diacid regulator